MSPAPARPRRPPTAGRTAVALVLSAALALWRGASCGAFTSPRTDGERQEATQASLYGKRPQNVRVRYAHVQTQLPRLEAPGLRSRPPEFLGLPVLALLAAAGGLGTLLAVQLHWGALGMHLQVPRTAKFFIAGGVGASLSHAIATPLDVIKTRQQAAPERYRSSDGKRLGIIETGARIAREESPRMLLQGMGATSSGYLLQGAFKFGLWELFKNLLGYSVAGGAHKVFVLVLAAFGADMAASLLLCPFERARIRLVSDPQFAHGTMGAVLRMVREGGFLAGLYGRGLAATLVKQQSYTIAKFTSFTLIHEALCGLAGGAPRTLLTLGGSVAAGLLASLASQPGDALQVHLSAGGAGDPRGSLLSTARSIGFKNLFAGWRARLLQIEVIVVSQLLVYDYMKMLVGL